MKTSQNPLDKLEIVVGKERLSEGAKAWVETNPVFYLHGCTNRMVLAQAGQPQNIPDLDENFFQVLRGKEAYQYALELVLGLHAKTRGETQIVAQFRQAWDEFKENAPEVAAGLEPVRQALMIDNTMLRREFTGELKPAYFENVARGSFGQEPGERALLVGDVKQSGMPTDVTLNVLRQMATACRRPSKIIVTYPGRQNLDKFKRQMEKEAKRYKIADLIEFQFFENAMNSDFEGDLLRVDTCYVTYPMGQDNDVDARIIYHWSQKEAYGGRLIHLGGPNTGDRHTRGLWLEADLENFIPPEAVTECQNQAKGKNEIIIDVAKNAASVCARMRAEGCKRPSATHVKAALESQFGDQVAEILA